VREVQHGAQEVHGNDRRPHTLAAVDLRGGAGGQIRPSSGGLRGFVGQLCCLPRLRRLGLAVGTHLWRETPGDHTHQGPGSQPSLTEYVRIPTRSAMPTVTGAYSRAVRVPVVEQTPVEARRQASTTRRLTPSGRFVHLRLQESSMPLSGPVDLTKRTHAVLRWLAA